MAGAGWSGAGDGGVGAMRWRLAGVLGRVSAGGLGAVFALQSVRALIALQATMAGRWFDSVPVRQAQDGALRQALARCFGDAGIMAGAPTMPVVPALLYRMQGGQGWRWDRRGGGRSGRG